MKRNLFMALLCACALTACGGSSDSNDGQKSGTTSPSVKGTAADILALEESGDIPRLERGDSLAGADLDGNGIRDDIDAYIDQRYSGEERQSAARQFARAMQASLLVPENDGEAARAVALRVMRGIVCTYSTFDDADAGKVIEEIRAITTNTQSRLLAHLAYDRALDGMAFALPKGDACE